MFLTILYQNIEDAPNTISVFLEAQPRFSGKYQLSDF